MGRVAYLAASWVDCMAVMLKIVVDTAEEYRDVQGMLRTASEDGALSRPL